MDKEELVDEWMRFAYMDFDNAKYLFETRHPAPLEIICYHCQQSSEKYLKAVIIFLGDEPEKTHDLLKIIAALKQHIDFPTELEDFAEILTLYGVRTRYPQAIELDEDTTKLAISQAEQVKVWAEKIIAEKSSEQSSQEDETADTTTD